MAKPIGMPLCPECNGSGEFDTPTGRVSWSAYGPEQEFSADPCPECDGTGEVQEFECPECGDHFTDPSDIATNPGGIDLCNACEQRDAQHAEFLRQWNAPGLARIRGEER